MSLRSSVLRSVLKFDLPSTIGFLFAGISYGIYCVIFVIFLRIRLKKKKSGSKALLYLIIANFIACTALIVVDIAASRVDLDVLPFLEWEEATDALYICVEFISQVILIYRCWIMWHGQAWVIAAPILLTIAFIVLSVTTLADSSIFLYGQNDSDTDVFLSFTLSFFSLSLAQNALCTGLIVFKILTVYREVQGSDSLIEYTNGQIRKDIVPVVSILIETGLITVAAQLVQIFMYKFANAAFPIYSGVHVLLLGISTAIVLVRVEMGLSYDVDNKTLNSTLRFAPSELECSRDDTNLPSN